MDSKYRLCESPTAAWILREYSRPPATWSCTWLSLAKAVSTAPLGLGKSPTNRSDLGDKSPALDLFRDRCQRNNKETKSIDPRQEKTCQNLWSTGDICAISCSTSMASAASRRDSASGSTCTDGHGLVLFAIGLFDCFPRIGLSFPVGCIERRSGDLAGEVNRSDIFGYNFSICRRTEQKGL